MICLIEQVELTAGRLCINLIGATKLDVHEEVHNSVSSSNSGSPPKPSETRKKRSLTT